MNRNQRWNRHLVHTFFGCLMITVAFKGISQHSGEEGGRQHHGQASEGRGLHHDFSDAEHWTAIFDSDERAEWQNPVEVVTLMEIEPGMTVVDLGAGTGFFLGYLAAAVESQGRVLALDPELSLVDFMKERAAQQGWSNVEPRQIPYDDPEVEDRSADRILIVNTWHHIDSRPSYAAKLRRALKSDGKVYIVDFTLDSPSGPPQEHRLPPEQIIHELESGGFHARQIEESLPRQFIVVGFRESGGG